MAELAAFTELAFSPGMEWALCFLFLFCRQFCCGVCAFPCGLATSLSIAFHIIPLAFALALLLDGRTMAEIAIFPFLAVSGKVEQTNHLSIFINFLVGW